MTSRPAPAAPDTADPGRLFAGLAGRRGLVLAVSGGPDSTALMVLAARWSGRPPVIVASIDHGLREGSADEAALVIANAATLGFAARTVTMSLAAGGNLQDRARRARYAALADIARAENFDTIVTAHHRDDQAETLLLRLARGSGVYGLASMRAQSELGDLVLARPLLALARDDLGRIAAESGLATVTDPSNADPRFDRVRVRAAMPALAALGLDAEGLAETAVRMARAADALDHYAGALLAENFTADAYGRVRGAAAALAAAPDEVALRALARLVQAVGGAPYTPPLAGLEAVLDAIRAGQFTRRTLGGIVLDERGGRLMAQRELGRTGLDWLAADRGAVDWDRRFRIDIPAEAAGLRIGALAAAGRRLKAPGLAAPALRTLPGLYCGGDLIAAPPGIAAIDGGAALLPLTVRCLVGERLKIPLRDGALAR